jgi:hypothetical protein
LVPFALAGLLEVSSVGDVVQLRDFKRREEREAADVRLAKAVMGLDTAPSDMPPVWPSYQAPESDPA